jgi:ATP-dependent helicase/nuclease subunit A
VEIPAWATRPPEPESPAWRYAQPSRAAESERGAAPSPLAQAGGLGRFRRGEIIHRLLQLLPDVAPAERSAAAQRLLASEQLSAAQQSEMAAAAFGVLEDPAFAQVFAPGSRAEAAIAGTAPGLPQGLRISGRVDRLAVTPDRVLVVDFKTNRPAPARIGEADRAYVLQMALYWAVLRELFPGRAVEAALVWTDGPKLMPVPEELMAKALETLA